MQDRCIIPRNEGSKERNQGSEEARKAGASSISLGCPSVPTYDRTCRTAAFPISLATAAGNGKKPRGSCLHVRLFTVKFYFTSFSDKIMSQLVDDVIIGRRSMRMRLQARAKEAMNE